MTNKRDKNFVTLGLNFFENYYSIFDVANKRIGFQDAKMSKNGLSLDDSFDMSSISQMLILAEEKVSELVGDVTQDDDPDIQ